jgi:hypothetical protein
VTNENIADQVNTIQKISQKRALVAATLLAVNGSEFFTQDSEEFMIEPERSRGGPPVVTPPRQQAGDTEMAPGAASVAQPDFLERIKQEQWQCTPAQKQMIINLLAQIISRGADEQELSQRLASDHAVDSPSALPSSAAPRYIGSLRRVLQSLEA